MDAALETEDRTVVLLVRSNAPGPDHGDGRAHAGWSSPEPPADRAVVMLDQAHGRGLHGFAMRMGLSADEADDAVQETLLRLWTALRDGAPIADQKAWAYRAIYRLSMDQHRWRRRIDAIRSRLLHDSGSRRSGQALADARLSIWVEVDRLPLRQREIVYLRYRADLTFEDAAAVMGITPGAARANATKAMKSLRSSVGDREMWR